MAEMLKFKKGLYAALPPVSELTVGTVYVTTDEQAMYVDVAKDRRIRLSDIVQVKTVSELASYAPDYSRSALYYVIDSNALLKFVGETAEGKYEWKQINSTSEIEADIAELAETVKGHGESITGINTSIDNITKKGGLIDAAKQAAISAAAADATSKANTAEANAKADTKEKVDALTLVVNGKVATETFNTAVSTLEGAISDAQKAAESHANSVAATAKSEAIADAEGKISAAKTELEDKIDEKVDQTDFDAFVGAKANGEVAATGIYADIAAAESAAKTHAETKASEAESAAKTYADGLKTGLETTITNGLKEKVDKTVYEANLATLETKTDAAKKLVDAKAYTDTEVGKAKTYADEKVAAHDTDVKAELAKKADADAVATSVANLNTAIATAKSDAITEAGKLATAAQSAAEATAAAALKTAKENLEKSIDDLSDVVDGKVDTTTLNSTVEQIGKDIAAAEGRAAADAQDKADAAEAAAKAYTNTREAEINKAVALKADQSALETAVSDLTTAIGTAKQSAIDTAKADATSKANTAEANAKSYTDTKIGEVNTALGNKLDTATFNQFVGAKATEDTVATGIYADIDAAETKAKIYADGEIAKALQGADAMTFKGVLGGEGNTAALPAAADTNAGDTWKIGAAGEYAGYDCHVGDLLIAKEDKLDEYWHVSSGYEAEYNPTLAKKADNSVALLSAVGAELGSVAFVADASSAATVSVAQNYDPVTQITNATVTVGMAWGEF